MADDESAKLREKRKSRGDFTQVLTTADESSKPISKVNQKSNKNDKIVPETS